MALTTAQRLQFTQLMVGMFNAAPGSVLLDQYDIIVQGGFSLDRTAQLLAGTGAFHSLYAVDISSQVFAQRFVDNLLGTGVSSVAKDALVSQITAYLGTLPVDQVDAGRGSAIYIVAKALSALPTSDATWGPGASLFGNRVTAADYYSFNKGGNGTDLTTLQSVVTSVRTERSSLVAVMGSIDAAISTSPSTPVAPPLLTNPGVTIYGGDQADTLLGGVGDDVLVGFGGNDTLTGGLGANYIDAGAGDDSIVGAQANDLVDGGSGNDTLKLDSATVNGNAYIQAIDSKLQGVETISISGNTSIRLDLTGQSEDFTIKATGANGHVIKGGDGINNITGSEGNDTIIGAVNKDTINGGAGTDTLKIDSTTVSGNAYAPVTDAQLTGIEIIDISGSVPVTVNLASQSEKFMFTLGGVGQTAIGGSGNDTFIGARSVDALNGGGGANVLQLSSVNVVNLDYRQHIDDQLVNIPTIAISGNTSITLNLRGQTEPFSITLSGANGHTVTAGSGADVITSGDGPDTIDLSEIIPARDTIVYSTIYPSVDLIRDFSAGSDPTSDQIKLAKTLLNGVGSSTATGIVISFVASAADVYASNTTIVIIRNAALNVGANLTAVASFLDAYGGNAIYGADDKMMFAIGDTVGDTHLYNFVSGIVGALVSASQLTQIAVLVGVAPDLLTSTNFTL